MLPARQRRMVMSCCIIALAFAAVLFQLYNVQLLHGRDYAMRAQSMESVEVALEEFRRGEITDRQGIPLAGGYYANRLVVFPALMADQEREMDTLSTILRIDRASLARKAGQGAFYITRPLSRSEHDTLQGADLTGVFSLPVYQRYGDNPLAVHISGYLGKINSQEQYKQLQERGEKNYQLGDWVGQAGLEYFYEQELKGAYPMRWARVSVDARGRIIAGPGLQVETAGQDPGRLNVVTTIDHRIQAIVEEIMDNNVTDGAVVVMKAGTGDILAMSSRPKYHPEFLPLTPNAGDYSDSFFVDRCTTLFQPGSVFKIVVAAAALEKGVVQESTMFNCTGEKAAPVRCWQDDGHGQINFRDAFAFSCNPAFVETGRRLGAGVIIEYAQKLGLDNQTITGYPIKRDDRQDLDLIGRPYNLANSCVGQGPVLVTPVQVTAMVNIIASQGKYYPPRLVAGLSDAQGRMVKSYDSPPPGQALSPGTTARLSALLTGVTDYGVGKEARVSGWGSAGKTGSAQVSGPEGTVNAWFAGYFPADSPRYVITVLVRGGKSGGATAAPLFKKIAERIAG